MTCAAHRNVCPWSFLTTAYLIAFYRHHHQRFQAPKLTDKPGEIPPEIALFPILAESPPVKKKTPGSLRCHIALHGQPCIKSFDDVCTWSHPESGDSSPASLLQEQLQGLDVPRSCTQVNGRLPTLQNSNTHPRSHMYAQSYMHVRTIIQATHPHPQSHMYAQTYMHVRTVMYVCSL